MTTSSCCGVHARACSRRLAHPRGRCRVGMGGGDARFSTGWQSFSMLGNDSAQSRGHLCGMAIEPPLGVGQLPASCVQQALVISLRRHLSVFWLH